MLFSVSYWDLSKWQRDNLELSSQCAGCPAVSACVLVLSPGVMPSSPCGQSPQTGLITGNLIHCRFMPELTVSDLSCAILLHFCIYIFLLTVLNYFGVVVLESSEEGQDTAYLPIHMTVLDLHKLCSRIAVSMVGTLHFFSCTSVIILLFTLFCK